MKTTKRKKRLSNADIRKMVQQKILQALDKGVNPWRKPWTGDNSQVPHNCASGHVYRGVNVWYLAACQMVDEYPTAQWLTFRQAKQLGGSVRKGEKASHIIFTKPLIIKKTDEDTGEETKKSIFMLRVSPVFNIAQCDNVKLPKREIPEPRQPLENGALVESVQLFMADVGAVVNYGGNSAHYQPRLDKITLPLVETFNSAEGFAATALHELVHWTGHQSRLERSGICAFSGFGSEGYAWEELIAEMGSAMLCHHFQVGNSEIENHASYIKGWQKAIKKDSRAIFKASQLAEAAVDYLKPEAKAKAA